jgi:hypothetical protein
LAGGRVTIDVVVDADAVLAGIRQARAHTRAIPTAIHRVGAFTQTVVRANASSGAHPPGRPHIPGTGPGPNVATGDYRRGITLTTEEGDGMAAAEVSTAAVQAFRLEFGFIGRDSLGRLFRQPPFPHWGPAEEPATAFADQQIDGVADQIQEALGGS